MNTVSTMEETGDDADAYFPAMFSILENGATRPLVMQPQFPQPWANRLYFRAPLSYWFQPQTGKPAFPRWWCKQCEKEHVLFRFLRAYQQRPGDTIFLAKEDVCDTCAPRALVHLTIRAELKPGQVFRFARFFYADGTPIIVKDPKSAALHTTDAMEFRIKDKKQWLQGGRGVLRVTTQPYSAR